VRSFGITDPGKVRTSNEDHFLIAELARTIWVRQSSLRQPDAQSGSNWGHLFLVADGMGGHQAGEVASSLAVTTIEAFLPVLKRYSNLQPSDEPAVIKDLQTAFRQADARIIEESAHHPDRAGMGTTLTMAFVSGWKLFVVHAGDSRCYLWRNGVLQQLTQDHTLVGELARRGAIQPDEVSQHRLRHLVTNVLGGGQAGVRAEVQKIDLEPGDRILLCSDGLTDMLDDEHLAAILSAEEQPQPACERLVAEANAEGGQDNITAVVASFEAQ
jgi:protein phosphatase